MTPDYLRRRLAGAVRSIVVGEATEQARPVRASSRAHAAEPGPIPSDSPVRVVHADPAMFVGGVRALLLQTLHPVAMQAVAEHSDYRNDPLGRLQRTASFLGATTFGSKADAATAIAMVRAVHERVTGTLPDGSTYRADDPHLLGWVHATEVDSFLVGFQRYGATRLDPEQADRYVADMAIIGSALGVEHAPTTRAELSDTLASYRNELATTRACRDATRFLFAPQLPLSVLPAYGLIFSASVGLLPRWARSMLLLPLAPGVDPLVLRPATRALTGVLRWAGVGRPT